MKIEIQEHLPLKIKLLIEPYLCVKDFKEIASEIQVSDSAVSQIYYRRLPISEKTKAVPLALINRALNNARLSVKTAKSNIKQLEQISCNQIV